MRQKLTVSIPHDQVDNGARTAIEKDLRRKEAKRLHKVWIDRLRKDAYIQIVKTDSQ